MVISVDHHVMRPEIPWPRRAPLHLAAPRSTTAQNDRNAFSMALCPCPVNGAVDQVSDATISSTGAWHRARAGGLQQSPRNEMSGLPFLSNREPSYGWIWPDGRR